MRPSLDVVSHVNMDGAPQILQSVSAKKTGLGQTAANMSALVTIVPLWAALALKDPIRVSVSPVIRDPSAPS